MLAVVATQPVLMQELALCYSQAVAPHDKHNLPSWPGLPSRVCLTEAPTSGSLSLMLASAEWSVDSSAGLWPVCFGG